jgi:hypothetical protein
VSDQAQEPVTEKWTCTGIRTGRGKRYIAWATPEGKELWYAERTARYALGATYAVKVTRDADHTTMHGVPEFLDPGRDPRVLEWRAAEIAAEAELVSHRIEKRAQRTDPLDEVLIPLVNAAAKLRTQAERRAFAAEVLRRLMIGAWS